LLIFILFPLVDNPGRLYYFFPESWYDAWEEFATMRLEGFLILGTFLLGLITGGLILYIAFSQRIRGWRKARLVVLYLFLLFNTFGIILPTLGHAHGKTARIVCGSNIKQIYLALQQYALDYESHLPPGLNTLSDSGYLTGKDVFRCPGRQRPNQEFSDYIYYGAKHTLREKTPFLLVKDRERNHLGKYCNLLMSDGEIIYSHQDQQPKNGDSAANPAN